MRVRRILAGALALCGMIAFTLPARAQDANGYNVLYGADITYVGLDDPHSRNGVYQDIIHLVDNEWAIGPKSEHGNYKANIVEWPLKKFDINGNLSASGDYAAVIVFELVSPATAAGFRLIHPDVTGASGVNDPLDFLLSDFDVLGSETGEDGTWKVLYEARDLRVGSDVEYLYCESETADGIPYWEYEAKFDGETEVSYVALAIHNLNLQKNTYGKYINLHEFQIFSPERYTGVPPEATGTAEVPVTQAPAKDPLTVADFIPETPLGWLIVSSVLATGCSVGCMAWERKKETTS